MKPDYIIHEFKDSFVLSPYYKVNNGFTITDKGYLKKYGSAILNVKKNGEQIVPTIKDGGGVALFNTVYDDTIEIFSVKVQDVVETYTSESDNLKDIDKETYESLSPNFKKKYREVIADKVDVETLVDADEKFIFKSFDVNFDDDVYSGSKFSELRGILSGAENIEKYDMDNFSPRSIGTVDVLKALKSLYEKEKNELKQLLPDFLTEYTRGHWPDRVLSGIEVKYFVEEYKGQTKKRLHKKQNGQPYADRRGTYYPDYPDVASTVIVRSEDFDTIEFSDNDDDNLEIIKSIYKAIFRP